MSASITRAATPSNQRSALITRPLLLRFVSILGASTSFFLLLSVIPLFARSRAGDQAAGASTAALMLATVLGELVTPWFVARCGYRLVLGCGLGLLGLATVGFLACHSLAAIILVCGLRGLGFAATIVAGGALTASLLPGDRRGEGLALVGIVSGLPSVAGLPLGVWVAAHFGYRPVILIGALSSLLAVTSVPGLPDRLRGAGRHVGMFTGLRTGSLARPAVVFAITALAAGILVTFLPIVVPRPGMVSLALLLESLAATLIRMLVGRYGDRHGPGRLVLPGLMLSVAGTLVLADRATAAVLAGAIVFGAGFGVTQNATLCLMYARVPEAAYGTVSGVWNLAYDGGMGIGVVGFGFLAEGCGYPTAFCITGAAMLAAVGPWAADRRQTRGAQTIAPASEDRDIRFDDRGEIANA
jgi:predicted MFS family arabinose efflux permease